MSDEPTEDGGIFGKLPDARPGTRSPRRRAGQDGKTAKAKAKPATKAKAKPAPKPKAEPKPPPKTPPPPPPPPRAEREAPAAHEQQGGLSDVAWAGIAVAAEAATLGVRLASRAIEAVRGNPERGNPEQD